MKKLALLAALICLGFVSASATPTPAAQPSFTPAHSNPVYMPNLAYYGSSSYYVEASTPSDTAVLLATGSGYLYGMECSSGTLGDFGMALDSASASGITINTKGESLTPAVFSAVAASSSSATVYFGVNAGPYVPPGGAKRFVNGLVAIKHGSGNANCIVSALLDATIQAAPQTH